MYIKRAAELKLLEEQYQEAGNNLIILYGRKGMGKTTLLSEFIEGKQSVFYYQGAECVDRLQLYRMNRQAFWQDNPDKLLDYPILFSEFIGMSEGKAIIILDEFHYIMKNCPGFIETFRLLSNKNRPVMFVLCSSSIRWVENEMIHDLGNMAVHITSYLKLKEITFVDFVERFPRSSVETCIYINAILGGIPQYLDEWMEDKSVKENIIHSLLNKNSRLYEAPQQHLKLELREPAVYNTILAALAEGNRKLNDLHAITEFSRAKISVYLKHLIELDLVEKLTPLSQEGRDNVKKGMYRIKDNFINFWYRFVFPNLSELMRGKADNVYEEKVAPYLNEYMQEYFADVCTEFLKLMNLKQKLPEKILWWERWYGKNGTLDILAQSEKGKNLVGNCIWKEKKADLNDYDTLQSLAADAGKEPDSCFLCSKEGFTEELRGIADSNTNLTLVELDDL